MHEKAHATAGTLTCPGLVRVCFDSPAPVQLVLRLIRSVEPMRNGSAATRAAEFEEGQSYCLLDARIDDATRCATIFEIVPRHRLILGGVYPAKSLETSSGLEYLRFLHNPQLASGAKAARHYPGERPTQSNHQGINSALTLLLLNEGDVLRSATLADITHLAAEHNYVRLHLANGENIVVRGPLQKYEDVLPETFIRASRHVIINVGNVQRLRRVSRDLGVVYFASSEHPVQLGRKASTAVRVALMSRSRLTTTRPCRMPKRPAKPG